MLKLLLFADSSSIHTRKWIEILKNEYEIHLVSFSGEEIPGIKNYYVNIGEIKASGINYKYLFRIITFFLLIRKIKPDIINAHYITSYGFIASLVKPKKIPLILSVHGTDIMVTPKKNFLFKSVTKYTLKKANHIFSVASHMTREIRNLIRNDIDVTTIQYGIDVDTISKNFFKEKKIDFITIRKHIPNSNIGIILQAFKKYIEEVNPKAIMYILGDGPQLKKNKECAGNYSILNNTIFMGKVNHNKLISLMKKSKVYISLTSSDGMSISLLEAMACKCIPIVSEIDANKEWISDNKNGYLSAISPDDLFSKLKIHKYDQNMVNYNHEKVRSKGNLKINSKIILGTIKQICNRKNEDIK